MEELIGRAIGQYEIVEKIGEGGMGLVFKARQRGLERWVAIKILPPQYAVLPGFQERFLREARSSAQLEHPHILPVYDFGQQDRYTYLVMRYIEGSRTLAGLMRRPSSFQEIINYLKQVADALDYAHQHGIIHRDIKPGNILIDQKNWLFLADFGLARLVEATTQLTGTGVGVGTPAYMSPEQGAGGKVDARTDVYAVGVIAYQMLTGQIPHQAETPHAIIYKRNNEPPPSLRSSNPTIPAAIDTTVQTALARTPDERFQSTGSFVTALEQAVEQTKAGQLMNTTLLDTPLTPSPPPISSQRFCANCGARVGPGLRFCPACGVSLITPGAPSTPAPAALPAPKQAGFPVLWLAVAGIVVLALAGLAVALFILLGRQAGEAEATPVTVQQQALPTLVVSVPTATSTPEPVRPTPPPAQDQPGGGDTLTLPPTPTSTPPPTPAAAVSPSIAVEEPAGPLADDFDGAALDSQRWAFTAGEGQVLVQDGAVQLTSIGKTFPFIYSRTNPFPDDGNFSLKVTLRYLSVAERGTGLRIGTAQATYGSEQAYDAAELSKGRLIEVWQDVHNWHVSVGEENNEVYTLPAPVLDAQELSIDYVDTIYRVAVNGREVFVSKPGAVRPKVLWFGNPAEVDAAGAWSGLAVDRVVVEEATGPLITSSEPTPTDTPAPTPTDMPTPTGTPTPPPPPLLGQNCTAGPGATFDGFWQDFRHLLGCPTATQTIISVIAEELFQGGHMFWRKDTDEVYAIYDRQKEGGELSEGQWQTDRAWKWDGSYPEGTGLAPPPGLIEPIRGFGFVWRNYLNAASGPLGWALDKEYGFENLGQAQAFEQGLMFKGSSNKTYILLYDGRFFVR